MEERGAGCSKPLGSARVAGSTPGSREPSGAKVLRLSLARHETRPKGNAVTSAGSHDVNACTPPGSLSASLSGTHSVPLCST